MTKEEYQEWIKLPYSKRSHVKCAEADRLIQNVTFDNFRTWCDENIMDEHAHEYIQKMVAFHYGSIETDELLTKLGMYPDWMER